MKELYDIIHVHIIKDLTGLVMEWFPKEYLEMLKYIKEIHNKEDILINRKFPKEFFDLLNTYDETNKLTLDYGYLIIPSNLTKFTKLQILKIHGRCWSGYNWNIFPKSIHTLDLTQQPFLYIIFNGMERLTNLETLLIDEQLILSGYADIIPYMESLKTIKINCNLEYLMDCGNDFMNDDEKMKKLRKTMLLKNYKISSLNTIDNFITIHIK